jgi:hypothetical protein
MVVYSGSSKSRLMVTLSRATALGGCPEYEFGEGLHERQDRLGLVGGKLDETLTILAVSMHDTLHGVLSLAFEGIFPFF